MDPSTSIHTFEGFSEKVAIVTGGASLISREVIALLLAGGCFVVATDLSASEHLVADLGPEASFRFVGGDLGDESHIQSVVDGATEEFGGIDLLVNGAASFADPALAATPDEWRRSFEVNVIAAARLIALCRASMAARGGGAVVNIASISGLRAQPDRLLYPVTKAALLGLTRSCSLLLAGERTRVNAVLPGWTWSRNIERRYGTRDRADLFAAEFQALGRMASPSEVAEAVVFLLSDRASFVTGAELAVDGGYAAMGPEALGQAFERVPTTASRAHRFNP